jgi:hypothetical protein
MSNCYTCSFRKNTPGDCHSSCSHPVFNDNNNAMKTVMLIMRQHPASMAALEQMTGIRFDSYGVQSGWVNFPLNYDPIWLKGDCKYHNLIGVKEIS